MLEQHCMGCDGVSYCKISFTSVTQTRDIIVQVLIFVTESSQISDEFQ